MADDFYILEIDRLHIFFTKITLHNLEWYILNVDFPFVFYFNC